MPLRFPACSCAASPSRPRPPRALERQQRAWARAERATGTFAETFPVQADTVSASPTGPPPVVDPLQERRTHRLPLPGAAVHTSDWLDGSVLERDLAPAWAEALRAHLHKQEPDLVPELRSEERRVGKEGRSRWP